jgi:hypothetical protein
MRRTTRLHTVLIFRLRHGYGSKSRYHKISLHTSIVQQHPLAATTRFLLFMSTHSRSTMWLLRALLGGMTTPARFGLAPVAALLIPGARLASRLYLPLCESSTFTSSALSAWPWSLASLSGHNVIHAALQAG